MKKFTIKSSLALGLSHRLRTMDAQVVVDACCVDAIQAIRSNQRVAGKLDEANKEFAEAVADTETKKRAIFQELQDEYKKESEGKTAEEKAAMGKALSATFHERAAVVQKESKADPEVFISVELSDEDYEKVLLPVFKKTVQLWDVDGDGKGQSLFLEVANALEAVETV